MPAVRVQHVNSKYITMLSRPDTGGSPACLGALTFNLASLVLNVSFSEACRSKMDYVETGCASSPCVVFAQSGHEIKDGAISQHHFQPTHVAMH